MNIKPTKRKLVTYFIVLGVLLLVPILSMLLNFPVRPNAEMYNIIHYIFAVILIPISLYLVWSLCQKPIEKNKWITHGLAGGLIGILFYLMRLYLYSLYNTFISSPFARINYRPFFENLTARSSSILLPIIYWMIYKFILYFILGIVVVWILNKIMKIKIINLKPTKQKILGSVLIAFTFEVLFFIFIRSYKLCGPIELSRLSFEPCFDLYNKLIGAMFSELGYILIFIVFIIMYIIFSFIEMKNRR